MTIRLVFYCVKQYRKEIWMKDKYKASTLSIEDVIHAFNKYDASPEEKEHILYFVSEITGISVDEICTSYEDV